MRTGTQLAGLLGICLLGCSASAGDVGDTGDPGPTGPVGPSASPGILNVSPASTSFGRKFTLQVVGYSVHFGATSTISLGDPEITVGTVTALGGGTLRAPVQIGWNAKAGAHDVVVTTPKAGAGGADEVVTLAGLFSVNATLVGVPGGANSASTQTGGLFSFGVRSVDFQTPFGGEVALAGGRSLSASIGQGGTVTGLGLVDAGVLPGPYPVKLSLNNLGQVQGYGMAPTDASITTLIDRTPKPLVPGTALTNENMPTGNLPSTFYKTTAAADNQVVLYKIQNGGGGFFSGLYGVTAPPSGKFNEGYFVQDTQNGALHNLVAYVAKSGAQYLSLFPRTLAVGPGMDFSITALLQPGQSFDATEPPSEGPGAPGARFQLTGGAFSQGGAFDYIADADYYKITPQQSGRLYVSATVAGLGAAGQSLNPGVIPVVTLLDQNCQIIIGAGQQLQQEIAVSSGQAYCAKVGYLGTLTGPVSYQAAIYLEQQ